MEYKEAVSFIHASIKNNWGAITEICKDAGLEGRQAYYNALGKSDWEDLSKAQRRVIDAALKYIERMPANTPDPLAQRAAKLMGTSNQ